MCVCVFSSEPDGRLTVLSVKAMLAMLCGGKLVDKIRCEYRQMPSWLTRTRLQLDSHTFPRITFQKPPGKLVQTCRLFACGLLLVDTETARAHPLVALHSIKRLYLHTSQINYSLTHYMSIIHYKSDLLNNQKPNAVYELFQNQTK